MVNAIPIRYLLSELNKFGIQFESLISENRDRSLDQALYYSYSKQKEIIPLKTLIKIRNLHWLNSRT